MSSETEIIVAFLFKRSGKEKLKLSELYLPLSMDLKWFPPKQAKDFVKRAVEQKLLVKKGGSLKPTFDCEKIIIPVGFQPSKQSLEEKKERVKKEKRDMMKIIINRVVEKTDLIEQDVVEKIKAVEKEKNITSEAATLLVGKEYDIPLEDCFEEIEDKIFRESRE